LIFLFEFLSLLNFLQFPIEISLIFNKLLFLVLNDLHPSFLHFICSVNHTLILKYVIMVCQLKLIS
jgi:hypothetical protein